MKKIVIAAVIAAAVIVVAAAAAYVILSDGEDSGIETSSDVQIPEGASTAVVYFTWSNHAGTIAASIGNITGDSPIGLVPETAYPDTYDDIVQRAESEIGQRPAIEASSLSSALDAMHSADYIFLGYPIWYQNCPKVILTLIDEYNALYGDMSGRTIIPFCTSASSSPDTSYESIRSESGATVANGFWCTSSHADGGIDDDVASWLSDMGISA